jgi:hypothetical protein
MLLARRCQACNGTNFRYKLGDITAFMESQPGGGGAGSIRNPPRPGPGREQTGDNLLEVTEFSEAPLDPRLFEVPADFHRVVRPLPGESFSWIDQLIYYWQEIEDWFGHL